MTPAPFIRDPEPAPTGPIDGFDDPEFVPLFENGVYEGIDDGDEKPDGFEASLLSLPSVEKDKGELAPKYRSLDLTP